VITVIAADAQRPASSAAARDCAGKRLSCRFVPKHKGVARPGVSGYKEIGTLSDLENPLLQHHRAGESIQDKSLDARLN
jgi:hypothetical protein